MRQVRFLLSGVTCEKGRPLDVERVMENVIRLDQMSATKTVTDAVQWSGVNIKYGLEVEVVAEYMRMPYVAANLWMTMSDKDGVLFRLFHPTFPTEDEVTAMMVRNNQEADVEEA